MKTLISTLILAVSFTAFAQGAEMTPQVKDASGQTESGKVEQELTDLTRTFTEAVMKRDVRTLGNLLAEDYYDFNGHEGFGKAELFEALKDPNSRNYSSYQRKVLRVQLHGDTAVVFASNCVAGEFRREDESFVYSFNSTDVWVRQNGRWQCITTLSNEEANEEEKWAIVINFNTGVSKEQIDNFIKERIITPGDSRQTPVKGISSYSFAYSGNFEVVGIQLSDSSERLKIKARIKASPLVYKVFDNVAPSDLKCINSNQAQTGERPSPVGQEKLPDWLVKLIREWETPSASTNPPTDIFSYTYRNQTVYYLLAGCCDAFNNLYSADGKFICHASGGFTGVGDGKCSDFSKERKDERLVWQRKRNSQ